MARKPCAQSVPQLTITSFNCGCPESKGRFSRIARNAILPFYYNCDVPLGDVNNKNETCQKVFYIKNPGSQITQAMQYAHLSRKTGRTVLGKRSTAIIPPSSLCSRNTSVLADWYPCPDNLIPLLRAFCENPEASIQQLNAQDNYLNGINKNNCVGGCRGSLLRNT